MTLWKQRLPLVRIEKELTKQPRAHRVKVSTFSARGAEPMSISLSRPPMPSWTFLKTNMSQKLLFLTIPLLISLSLALMAMLKSIRLMQLLLTSDLTLSYILFSRRGTAGIMVGLKAFMSSESRLMSPE